MTNIFPRIVSLSLAFLLLYFQSAAQLAAYTPAEYIDINVGYINYPFSNAQVNTGFNAQSITVPHAGISIVIGHQFNRSLAGEVSYTAPFKWTQYNNVNGDNTSHSVWMTLLGLSLKPEARLSKKIFISGKGGLSVVSRRGFSINNSAVVDNANYISFLVGAGMQYKFNDNLSLGVNALYFPADSKQNQPHTSFVSAGVKYNPDLHNLPPDKNNTYIFPKHLIQVAYSTNTFGYGVNDLVSKGAVKVFWSGDVYVKNGVSLQYQSHLYSGRKIFSIYWGANLGWWTTINNNRFFTASVFPVFRITFLHSKPVDLYFNYSVAGPSYISRSTIDNFKTGTAFIFQDYMGLGAFIGKHKKVNAEIKIIHYSNGDIHPENAGITVPLTFNIGHTF